MKFYHQVGLLLIVSLSQIAYAADGSLDDVLPGSWQLATYKMRANAEVDAAKADSRISIFPAKLHLDHKGQMRGTWVKNTPDGEKIDVRSLKIQFFSKTEGEFLLASKSFSEDAGNDDDQEQEDTGTREEFHRFFAFAFHEATKNIWISQGEWFDGDEKGLYTLQVNRGKSAVFSRTNSAGEVEFTIIELLAAPEMPQSFLKKYGMTALMLIAFVASKVVRSYFSTPKQPATRRAAGAARPATTTTS